MHIYVYDIYSDEIAASNKVDELKGGVWMRRSDPQDGPYMHHDNSLPPLAFYLSVQYLLRIFTYTWT